jgi:hypothetical protein
MTETLAADRVAIADLLSRYGQAADGRDTPSVAALFAAASCLMLYVAPTEAGPYGVAGLMRYDDELVRRDGQWLFGRRNVSALGSLNA